MKSPIDFTLLCDRTKGYAVHCTTEEDAAMFVEWARRLYPNRTSNWNDGETNFDSHGDKTVYMATAGRRAICCLETSAESLILDILLSSSMKSTNTRI